MSSERTLETLEPRALWENFYFMCGIPHGSGNVTAIMAALKERAIKAGLKAEIEHCSGNLLIVKEADPGFESAPVICLQGHADMVCSKRETTEHDFLKDPIRPRLETVDGTLCMYAHDTTLGADDGIGVATGLAIACDKSIKTGRLEVLVTVDEETTMHGVHTMGKDLLKSKYLLNLDSEDLGIITIGSAGGFNGEFHFMDSTFKTASCDSCTCLTVGIEGCTGGHSGVDIHLYRANAIKLVARILDAACSEEYQGKICSIKGGSAHNAIPMDCTACLCFCGTVPETVDKFCTRAREIFAELQEEYKTTDPDMSLKLERKDSCSKCFHAHFNASRKLVDFLLTCPSGVLRMSQDVPGLVESSMNIGKVRFDAASVAQSVILTLSRSSVNSFLAAHDRFLSGLGRMSGILKYGGKSEAYGGWTPNPKSHLLHITEKHYKKACPDIDIKVEAIHAGLECGEIISKYPHMEAVSIGPTIRNPHSDTELCEVDTVPPFYEVVKGIVLELAQEK